MIRLSPHFTLDEFTVSNTAAQHGILNTPTEEHLKNLIVTAAGFEEARSILGRAIVITSGYRNPQVNKLVGGVANSDHAKGFAGDFHVAGYTPFAAGRILATTLDFKFDQLIYEKSRGILHLSFAPRMRRQVLTQRGGPGTPVEVGINA